MSNISDYTYLNFIAYPPSSAVRYSFPKFLSMTFLSLLQLSLAINIRNNVSSTYWWN